AHGMFDLDHVIDRNPFGDANNQIETCFHALEDCVCGKRGRNKNHRNRCARLLHRLVDRIENRDVIREELAAFARSDTGDDIRSIVKAELRVAGAKASSDALHDNAGLGSDKKSHNQRENLRRWIVNEWLSEQSRARSPNGSPTDVLSWIISGVLLDGSDHFLRSIQNIFGSDQLEPAVRQRLFPGFDVVPLQPNDQRNAEVGLAGGVNYPMCDDVTIHDATENIH